MEDNTNVLFFGKKSVGIISYISSNLTVDGEWSPWSGWNMCSSSCGAGTQWRTRTCEGRAHGGDECPGTRDEQNQCNTQPCPSKTV